MRAIQLHIPLVGSRSPSRTLSFVDVVIHGRDHQCVHAAQVCVGHVVQVCVTWFKYVVVMEFRFNVHEFLYALLSSLSYVQSELCPSGKYCTIVGKMLYRVLCFNYV